MGKKTAIFLLSFSKCPPMMKVPQHKKETNTTQTERRKNTIKKCGSSEQCQPKNGYLLKLSTANIVFMSCCTYYGEYFSPFFIFLGAPHTKEVDVHGMMSAAVMVGVPISSHTCHGQGELAPQRMVPGTVDGRLKGWVMTRSRKRNQEKKTAALCPFCVMQVEGFLFLFYFVQILSGVIK